MSPYPPHAGTRRLRAATPARTARLRARLALERLELRDVPSSSIPLNGFTWTSIGPAPILPGQAPGGPASTGRVNAMAFDAPNTGFTANYPFASEPKDIYVGSDSGGIWHTFDGGDTWFPDAGYAGGQVQAMASVNRGTDASGAPRDTVYAFTSLLDGSVEFATSTNSAVSFTRSTSTGIPPGARVDKLVAVGINPMNQATDILYAAVSTGLNPLTGLANPGAGIYKNAMGGTGPWTLIATSTPGNTTAPFSPTSGFFTDVAVDPTDPNRVYAAVGNPGGDSFNGVYRTNNAAVANPVWFSLLGGSQFVPGTTPGNVKVAVSPVLPSVIFVSAGLRSAPPGAPQPLLGLFRSTDSGANFSPIYIASIPQTNDPNNYLGTGIGASENNVVVVDPFSPSTALGQRIYLAGNGEGTDRNVIFSSNSGNTLQRIGIGADGVGPYINVRAGQVDQQGRFVIAGGGGVYRLNSLTPVNWTSLNGIPGPNALNVVQFNGFALHPTDPDRATGNTANQINRIHGAVQFNDSPGAGNNGYAWPTVDTPPGTGQVIYNPFFPDIIYRVTDSSGTDPIRRSTDGGTSWTTVGAGYQAYPYQVGFATPPLAMDPSRPNRLFSGYSNIVVTDNGGDNWRDQIQTTLSSTLNFPDLPTSIVNENAMFPNSPSLFTGEEIAITALSSGRQSIGGISAVGTLVLAATTEDVVFDDEAFDYVNGALLGTQLWVNVIPDAPVSVFQGSTYDQRSWAKITPVDDMGNPLLSPFGEFITQILVDPLNDPTTTANTLYVYTNSGRILRGDFAFGLNLFGGPDMNVVVGLSASTWTEITGNVPTGFLVNYGFLTSNPQPLALDKNVVLTAGSTGPRVDRLYVGTNNGVFALDDPRKDFSTLPPSWNEVGVTFDPVTGAPIRSLPPVAVPVLSINSSTGILAAATYGRGAWEIQIRGLIRGRVFEDINGNGQFDDGEPPFQGVSVRLLDLNNNLQEVATADTDVNGFYEFRSLRAGNYRLVIANPGNLIQTTTPPQDFINFTEQSTFDGPNQVNFGYFRTATANGVKFEDLNNDGVQNNGEVGLPGFTIYLDYDEDGVFDVGVEPSQVSGPDGTYTFTNLGPDVILGNTDFVSDPNFPTYPQAAPYIFREIQQIGFRATLPVEGGFQGPFTPNSGDIINNVDFGNVRIAEITGSKFEDLNGNGVRNAGEPGFGGITIELYDLANPNVPFRSVVTDANGNYEFLSLPAPATYRVREVLPAGVTQTTPNPADIPLTVTSTISNVTFGNFRNVGVSGIKFDDTNGNGVQEPGEPGLGGFTIQLINSVTNSVVRSTVSQADGSFTFTDVGPLPNGAPYLVREVQQAGFVQTTPNPAPYRPVSGQDNTSFVFGNFGLYAISGTKFIDVNSNGVRDPGDRGAPGFIIGLDLNNDGTVDLTTVTAQDGSYSFPNVGPGTVRVFEQPRRGYLQTLPASPNGYVLTGISNVDSAGNDFGNSRRSAFVTGADAGGQPSVVLRDVSTNAVRLSFNAFPATFRGGVRVASGYFDNDLIPDIVAASGAGMASQVRVFRGSNGTEIFNLRPYEASFTGGIYVAVGDVNGDGFDDVITGAGEGGGPFVKVFSGLNGILLQSYFAYDPIFRGGVQVAAADLNNDGRADIVTGAGPTGGPHVKAFSGANQGLLRSFFPYSTNFRGGVFVATGDVNGDLLPDIITGPGAGGGPHVLAFDGRTNATLASFIAFPTTGGAGTPPNVSGARVASLDYNLDGVDDIIAAAGRGQPARVRVISGATQSVLLDFNAYDPAFLGGVFVGSR